MSYINPGDNVTLDTGERAVVLTIEPDVALVEILPADRQPNDPDGLTELHPDHLTIN